MTGVGCDLHGVIKPQWTALNPVSCPSCIHAHLNTGCMCRYYTWYYTDDTKKQTSESGVHVNQWNICHFRNSTGETSNKRCPVESNWNAFNKNMNCMSRSSYVSQAANWGFSYYIDTQLKSKIFFSYSDLTDVFARCALSLCFLNKSC